MQNRQYYLNPYQTVFQAKVTASEKSGDQYHIVLDNTIFYPEGGGQPSDSGFVDEIPVIDVYEQDGLVYHVLPELPKSNLVECRIDWQRRFYHMQHHTGQHLLSAIFFREFGYQTWGFHLSEDYSTLDITASDLPDELVKDAEIKVNRLIQADKSIKTYFISESVNQGTNLLRKEPQVDSSIRIVEISDYDAVPCCGTHLSTTGQVGLIKIMKTEKIRGMTRIYYRCGEAAFRDYQDKFETVAKLALMFSSSDQDVLARVTGELERKRELEQNYKTIKQQFLAYKAAEIVSQTESQLLVHHLGHHEDIDTAQSLAREILALGSFFVLITVGNRVLLSHNLNAEINCGLIVKNHGLPLGGRGGGKKDFAQVYFPSQTELDAFITTVKTLI